MKSILPWLLVLATITSSAWAGNIYRWVDEDGVTHYGESAPQNVDAQEVRTHRAPPQRGEARQSDGEAETEQQRRPATTQQPGGEQAATSSRDEERQELCDQHRANLELLESDQRVRSQDPDSGEARYLDDDERQQMLIETRRDIEEHCS